MSNRDIIVVGASAGGVEALIQLVAALPTDLPAAVFIVLHVPPSNPSILPRILTTHGALPAIHPTDGVPIERGRVYVAPPDHHLMVEQNTVRIVRGPRENNHRPSVDVLFRSAARTYGPRVIGVVLSGTLDDGAAGLAAITRQGGIGIVQDPDEALFSGMPRSAMIADTPRVLPVAAIAPLLAQLTRETVREQEVSPVSDTMDYETQIAKFEMGAVEDGRRPGERAGFSCPECGGTLWELREGELIRYRCRVGHAYAPDTLLASQSEKLEAALWAALRGLEEKASLSRRLTDRASESGYQASIHHFASQAREAEEHAAMIRAILLKGDQTLATGPSMNDG